MKLDSTRRPFPNKRKGVALLSVLAIVGITGILAFQLMQTQAITISHVSLTKNDDQLLAYCWAIEEVVNYRLYADWLEGDQRPLDNREEDWASDTVDFEIPDSKVYLQVIDQNAYFNVNALAEIVDETLLKAFYELTRLLYLDYDVAPKWKDWVDPDNSSILNGAEDYVYAAWPTPFRTPNQLAMDITEAQIFNKFDKKQMQSFREKVVVLPTASLKLNVNTVDQDVLETLLLAVDSRFDASTLIDQERNWTDLEALTTRFPDLGLVQDYLSVTSDFFLMNVTIIDQERGRIDYSSSFYRHPQTGEVTAYKRDYGQFHKWQLPNDNDVASLSN